MFTFILLLCYVLWFPVPSNSKQSAFIHLASSSPLTRRHGVIIQTSQSKERINLEWLTYEINSFLEASSKETVIRVPKRLSSVFGLQTVASYDFWIPSNTAVIIPETELKWMKKYRAG
jgi:hypothetical protein